MQKVVIVVSAAQQKEFERIFHRRPEAREYNSLPPRMQQYADAINEIGAKVSLVVQEDLLGLGHAVLLARPALLAEPFVLMLGDHLYRSNHERGLSCVAQLLAAYQGRSLMALRRTSEDEIHKFGCAAGRWELKRDQPQYKRLGLERSWSLPGRLPDPCCGMFTGTSG